VNIDGEAHTSALIDYPYYLLLCLAHTHTHTQDGSSSSSNERNFAHEHPLGVPWRSLFIVGWQQTSGRAALLSPSPPGREQHAVTGIRQGTHSRADGGRLRTRSAGLAHPRAYRQSPRAPSAQLGRGGTQRPLASRLLLAVPRLKPAPWSYTLTSIRSPAHPPTSSP
jgi:hypothetical protein